MCVFHQGVALESHAASEDGLLQFDEGDVILVLADTQEVSVCDCVCVCVPEAHFLWHLKIENYTFPFYGLQLLTLDLIFKPVYCGSLFSV